MDGVIFDLGRVLISFDWNRAIGKASKLTGVNCDILQKTLTNGPLLDDFECGRVTPAQFHQIIEKRLGATMPYEHFVSLWNGIFTEEVTPIANIARRLIAEGRLKVGVLSNTNALHTDFLLETWPLFRLLTNKALSQELGVRKPEQEAYHRAISILGTPAHKTVFLDDLEENVKAARQAGLQAIHVKDPSEAARELSTLLIN